MKKKLAKLVLLSIVIGLLMISLSFANGGRSSGFVTKRLLAFQTGAMDMEKLINIENCYLPTISKYAPEQLSEWQIVFKERKEILSSPEARELIKQINEIDKELEELKEKAISGEIEENKIIEKVMQILNELEELGINTKKAREWQSLNLRLSAALEAENQVEITKILKRMFKLEEERNEQLKSNLFKNKEQSQLILQNQDRTE